MKMTPLGISAIGLMAAAAFGAPAQALTFAQYGATTNGSNLTFTDSGVAMDGSATGLAGGMISGSGLTQFCFLTAGSCNNVAAQFKFDAVSTITPVNAYGVDIQPSLTGTFSFTYAGSPGGAYTTGENLLSGAFSGAHLTGQDGGSVGSIYDSSVSMSGGPVTYTSSVMTFPATGDNGFSLALTSINPGLFIGRDGNLTSFTADSTGQFSYTPSSGGGAGGVPEPATWAMMLIGFAGVGYARRSAMAAQRKVLA